MKKNIKTFQFLKYLCLILLAGILIYFYFSFLTVITKDSVNYYRYLEIFKGITPLKNWLPVRGPTMPLIIYLIIELFGDTSLGFLIGTFLFFIMGIGSAYLIIYKVLKNQKNKTLKIGIWISFILFFIFNPSIIGYYHAMLTEFVAITVALISCLLSIKWISIDISKEKIKFGIYSLLFIALSILMWFLKQPYVIVVLIPLFLGTFLSIFKIRKTSNTIGKMVPFFLCIICLLMSISIWDNTLLSSGSTSANSISENYLSGGLIFGASNFRKVEYKDSHDISFINSLTHLDSKEKEIITDISNKKTRYNDYDLYKVLGIGNNSIIDIIVVPDKTENKTSIADVGLFFNVVLRQYPSQILSSYAYNYLALIDLIPYDHRNLVPEKRLLGLNELRGENQAIGLAIYFRESTFLGSASSVGDNMRQYEMQNPSNLSSFFFAKLIGMGSLALLTLVLFLSPFLFAFFFSIYLLKKDSKIKQNLILYESLIILFGYSFLHITFHAITGAIVDRYSFVAYPTALLGCILLINFLPIKRIQKILKKF